jgi:hypothetical protein
MRGSVAGLAQEKGTLPKDCGDISSENSSRNPLGSLALGGHGKSKKFGSA